MEITVRLTCDATVSTDKNDRQVVTFNAAIKDSYKAKGSFEQVPRLRWVTLIKIFFFNILNLKAFFTFLEDGILYLRLSKG